MAISRVQTVDIRPVSGRARSRERIFASIRVRNNQHPGVTTGPSIFQNAFVNLTLLRTRRFRRAKRRNTGEKLIKLMDASGREKLINW